MTAVPGSGIHKLGLGTVQFGLDYGVSNSGGKTSPEEARHILAEAHHTGIRIIDTASMYGDSEEVLGASWTAGHSFQVVTKTPRLLDCNSADLLERTFHTSLERLKLASVYGLLVHNADDLLTPFGAEIISKMQLLREQGLVEKVGVSVYTGEQIDAILDRFTPDLVQLPLNVFDQRLLALGYLKRLKQRGVEIHVRSAFLQGLLLMDPLYINPYFAPIAALLTDYHETIRKQGLTPLKAALAFVTHIEEVDVVVCGVNNLSQFREICNAAEYGACEYDFSRFAVSEDTIINPALWKLV